MYDGPKDRDDYERTSGDGTAEDGEEREDEMEEGDGE